ncbi:MAG: hypothetical protein ACKOCC_07605 [Actinomycetota bacterium]
MRVRSLAIALLVLSLPACGGSDPAVLRMQMSPTGEGATNASADSKMMAPWSIDYELAPGLEKPAAKARSWKALLPDDARTRLVALARALGVKGEVYEQGTDQIAVGSPDAGKSSTEPDTASVTMWVGGGPGSWSYYPPMAKSSSGRLVEPCAPGAADAPDAPGCAPSSDATSTPPTIPEPKNLPSEAAALRTATGILDKAGYDTDSLVITATASTWSTFVSFEEKVDGLRTGNIGGIDFGENAAVIGAWGQFADYQGADTYPLIDLDDAVKRMSSGMWGSWMGVSGAMVKNGATSTRTDSAPSLETPETPVSSDAGAPPETVVSGGETTTTIARTTVVRITGVELALQNFYVSQDEVYLVPSYRFTDGTSEIGTVLAIPDKYLASAEPPIEPAPVDPGSSGSSGGSSGSGSTGQIDPGGAPTTDMPQIPDKDAASLVGLTEAEATKVATSKGWAVRVVERDGEQFMVTADWRGDRVNLTVTGGKVTGTSVG